jgi:dCMP deaminase
MKLAELTALRGTCNRLHVGCVLVDSKTKRIAAVGYNSSHSRTDHCDVHGCLMYGEHCIRTLHAEQAAIINLERKYEVLDAYITHEPCENCYKLLTAINVKKINCLHEYPDSARGLLMKTIKVPIHKMKYADNRMRKLIIKQ